MTDIRTRAATALAEMEAEGAEISLTKLRARLGNTGSYSTLSQVLRLHREASAAKDAVRVAENVPPVPTEFLEAMASAWAVAWGKADESAATVRRAFTQEQDRMAREHAEALETIDSLEASLDAANAATQAALDARQAALVALDEAAVEAQRLMAEALDAAAQAHARDLAELERTTAAMSADLAAARLDVERLTAALDERRTTLDWLATYLPQPAAKDDA